MTTPVGAGGHHASLEAFLQAWVRRRAVPQWWGDVDLLVVDGDLSADTGGLRRPRQVLLRGVIRS